MTAPEQPTERGGAVTEQRITEPPSESEIATLLQYQSPSPLVIMRRLVFQRDELQRLLAAAQQEIERLRALTAAGAAEVITEYIRERDEARQQRDAAQAMVATLRDGMTVWASQEDGVPDFPGERTNPWQAYSDTAAAAAEHDARVREAATRPLREVWAVVYSNYEPAEVHSLWTSEGLARDEATRLGGMWAIQCTTLRSEPAPEPAPQSKETSR